MAEMALGVKGRNDFGSVKKQMAKVTLFFIKETRSHP
jgi:hypothetical protein